MFRYILSSVGQDLKLAPEVARHSSWPTAKPAEGLGAYLSNFLRGQDGIRDLRKVS